MQAPFVARQDALAMGMEGAGSPQSSESLASPVVAIVELESEPVAARAARDFPVRSRQRGVDFESSRARQYESDLILEQADFKSRAALIAPDLKIRAQLRKLANAVSIEASPDDIAAISAMPGVKQIEMAREYRATLSSSVPLIATPELWNRLGGTAVAGNGIKIAILDTGIDITNPLFSDSGFTAPPGFPRTNNDSSALVNNKVIVAKSFLAGAPPPNANDLNGHGTNVAGIAAGNFNTASPLGSISGVAPRAFLGNYRVLGVTGSGRSDLIAQAVEEAVADGFDVINLSLGASAGTSLTFLDQTIETAVNVGGKIVVISAGNDGEDGPGSVTSPGVSPSAITVAAVTNSHSVGPVVSVTGPSPVQDALVGVASVQGAGSSTALDGSFASVPMGEVTTDRGCNALPAGSMTGKVALIERGTCSFSTKVNSAAQAGARAVVIYNQDISENADSGGETLVSMDVTGTTIPSVFIRRSSGLALRDFVRANPTATVTVTPIGSSAAISDVVPLFSSRGPTLTNTLKPEVAAPGVNIYSGAIKTSNADGVSDPSGFLDISGTSQAAPHIAGAAALLKQLNPSFTPAQVKSALVNSAQDAFLNTAHTTRAGVLDQGAGRVNLDRASVVSATFLPAVLSFGKNKLKKQVTVNHLLEVTALAGPTTFTFSIQQLDPDPKGKLTVTLSSTSLTLGAGQTGTIGVTIDATKKAEKRDYTGFVLVNGSDGQSFRVPYWGQFKKKI
jgi:subtilisin family serine protease